MDKLVKYQQPTSLGKQSNATLVYRRPELLMNCSGLPLQDRILGALTRLAAMTNRVVEPGVLVAYIERLEDIAPDILSEVFVKAEKGCKFFPTVAELREFAREFIDDRKERERRQREAAREAEQVSHALSNKQKFEAEAAAAGMSPEEYRDKLLAEFDEKFKTVCVKGIH